jgi:hypothetical protein
VALSSDAAMVLYYDIEGDTADHDDWHTVEHLHERMSIPGFVRATRWIAAPGTPRYLIVYEVDSVEVGTSPHYLARLNAPTTWTSAMMPRFRGMVRGFCNVVATAGYGLGNAAVSLRFSVAGDGARLRNAMSGEVFPAMAARRGVAAVHLLAPVPPPPMTNEQALRGRDIPMSWLVLATGDDPGALDDAVRAHLDRPVLERLGAADVHAPAAYAFHYTATALDVARSPAHAVPPSRIARKAS